MCEMGLRKLRYVLWFELSLRPGGRPPMDREGEPRHRPKGAVVSHEGHDGPQRLLGTVSLSSTGPMHVPFVYIALKLMSVIECAR